MKIKFLVLFLFISHATGYSQNIMAKIIDKNSKKPIPYATIKTGDYSGVISNEEGVFSLSGNVNTVSFTISCLGFQSKTLTVKGLKNSNYIVSLEESINQLNEIYISNRKPNVDSIIARIKRKFSENYDFNLKSYSIFYRSTDYIDFKNLDFEIDKASHVKKQQLDRANNDLDVLSRDIRYSKTIYFTDFKGEFFIQDKDSSKLLISKATKLIDQKNDFSLDAVEKRAQNLVLKYLDTTKTYKVKSGLFKVEDSLSLKNEAAKEKNKNELQVKDLKNNTKSLLKKSQFFDNSFLDNILNPKLYDFEFENISSNNGEISYIINYKPRKGKAKYSGKLFVSDNNYAITKIDYTYFEDRHGKKLNLKLLLGVKFIENVKSGLIIYQKNDTNIYQPKYIKEDSGNYFYVNRDLTLIENSRDRYKVSSNFKIEGNNRHKEELLITTTNTLRLNDYNAVKQEKNVTYKKLSKFDKSIWENEETLEPLEEMKRFGSN